MIQAKKHCHHRVMAVLFVYHAGLLYIRKNYASSVKMPVIEMTVFQEFFNRREAEFL